MKINTLPFSYGIKISVKIGAYGGKVVQSWQAVPEPDEHP